MAYKTLRNCIVCGKEYIRCRKTQKFCSQQCCGKDKLNSKQSLKTRKKRSKTLLKMYEDCKIKKQKFTKKRRKEMSERMKGRFSREKHWNWEGGINYASQGYIYEYSPNHPTKQVKKNYVYQHILVMEKAIKRNLTKEEVIHHVNGVRDDNRIENLALFTTNADHIRYHAALRKKL